MPKDKNNIEQLQEVRTETTVLARSFVANGSDPVLVFSAMLASTLDFGVVALQYDDAQLIRLLEQVLAERKQTFNSEDFKTAKALVVVVLLFF